MSCSLHNKHVVKLFFLCHLTLTNDDHSLKSNTMGDTSGAGTAYPPEASQTSHSRFVNSRYIFFV